MAKHPSDIDEEFVEWDTIADCGQDDEVEVIDVEIEEIDDGHHIRNVTKGLIGLSQSGTNCSDSSDVLDVWSRSLNQSDVSVASVASVASVRS